MCFFFFFFSSRRRHTRCGRDWSSDVCSSDLDLRFYDLRHTCASLLIREGASLKAVQRHMGHKTAAITLDTYGHLYPDELPGLAERFERLHAEAVAGLPATAEASSGVVQLQTGGR